MIILFKSSYFTYMSKLFPGAEVVFQCRDEGPLRAKVKWSRSDGLPLPPGSIDINGRLEMPGVMVSDSYSRLAEKWSPGYENF